MIRTTLNHRMTATDAAFVYAENDRNPMHIGCIEVVEGQLPFENFVSLVDDKLKLVPRYRHLMRPAPMGLGHPTWHDDPAFNVRNHVIRIQLEAPGDEAAFKRLTSRLFAGVLDRSRPLWKTYVIEGRADGNTGLMWLIHHAMVDGISGTEIIETVLDVSPHSISPGQDAFHPKPAPSRFRELQSALFDTAKAQSRFPVEFAQKAAAQVRRLRKPEARAFAAESPSILASLAKPIPKLPMNARELSGERSLSWGACSLTDIKTIRASCGGTVNDVVLATLGGAARRYFKAHNLATRGASLRAACPVSLRDDEQRGSLGNQVTILPVDIPLGTASPVARLKQVTRRTTALKRMSVAHGIDLAAQLFQGIHPLAQSLVIGSVMKLGGNSIADRIPAPPLAHMVCTNVPGPAVPLYAAGRRVLSHVPLLPVVPGMGLAMGVFSYAGTVHFGFIADTNAAPDVDRFAQFVDASFAELLDAAIGTAKPEARDELAAKRRLKSRAVAAKTLSKPKAAHRKPAPISTEQRRRAIAAKPV